MNATSFPPTTRCLAVCLGYDTSLIYHISAVELLALCNMSELDLGIAMIFRSLQTITNKDQANQ